jgi:glycosyltransferase involved in cell wall biosynthesis
MKMPKVSAIIPNYNHARFLEARLHSVFHQTYQDFEVIYLDDASTDESDAIFQAFAQHPRIRRVLRNAVNSGNPFQQWRKGIAESQGEYLWIAESDDYADPMFLEELVARLDAHPQAALAYCQSWAVTQDNTALGKFEEQWTQDLDATRWKHDFINDGKDECRQYLLFKNTIPNVSAVLIRRAVFDAVGGVDDAMRFCGDWLLWVKMLLCSDIVFVAKPLNYFRVPHAQSMRRLSQKGAVYVEEYFRVTHYICQHLDIPVRDRLDALERLMTLWLEVIVSLNVWDARLPFINWRDIPFSRQRTIFTVARNLAQTSSFWLAVRIIVRILLRILQKIGIVFRIKLKFRSRIRSIYQHFIP